MKLFCSDCGAKIATGSKFCTQCGSKINLDNTKSIYKEGQSRLDIKRPRNNFSEQEEISLENINFKKQSPIKVFVLTIVTLGIYYFICLYRWIDTLNKVRRKEVFNPTLAIILSIFSCGIGCIYFDYQIVKEYELLTKESGQLKISKNNLNPPAQNLKELVLYGEIFLYVISIASIGMLWIFAWFANAYLIVLIQQAVEYSLSVKANAE